MAQPTRYVLTSQDMDINHVVNNPMNLPLLLEQAFQNVPTPAGIGSSGKVFLGVRVPFPCLHLDHSIYAEQFLVANLALNSEPNLTHVAISAGTNFVPPSSHCCYLLREIHEPPNILIKNPSKNEYVTFNSLPQHPFPAAEKILTVWYMESFIPSSSVGPLQAALVDFMIKGGTHFEDIVKVVLVEKYYTEWGQLTTAKKILQIIAPHCDDVTVFYCPQP
ncbi:hypothetical protein N665_0593s0015 [Sinapis alba]|nr:hypothetical protein N665_0593s0015 [Sinapis alba]